MGKKTLTHTKLNSHTQRLEGGERSTISVAHEEGGNIHLLHPEIGVMRALEMGQLAESVRGRGEGMCRSQAQVECVNTSWPRKPSTKDDGERGREGEHWEGMRWVECEQKRE